MSFLKITTIGGITGFIFMLMGVICYPYSIGVFPVVDLLAITGLLVGLCLSGFVLLLLICGAVYYLFRLKFIHLMFVFPCLLPIATSAIIMPSTGKIPPKSVKEECAHHLDRISQKLKECAKIHDGILPIEDWCDQLLPKGLSPSDLCCRGQYRYFKEGESSYAMNIHVMGLTLSELPPDTVILYETDYAGIDPELTIPIQQRKSYESDSFLSRSATTTVRFGAWNQVGDIETITVLHHAGLGCNVLYADGHVEFIRKNCFQTLRWKP